MLFRSVVQEIQYVLAPAVMISSAALLLLGFQNRFSSLMNRFRALTHEKRSLFSEPNRTAAQTMRLKSLSKQISGLSRRVTYIKNAILLSYAAIVCFIVTSILLFVKIYAGVETLSLTVTFFLLGLLLIFADCVLMMIEISLAFQIVAIEQKSS